MISVSRNIHMPKVGRLALLLHVSEVVLERVLQRTEIVDVASGQR